MPPPANLPAAPQLIVALDLPAAGGVPDLLRRLPASIAYFKIGLELFIADGPAALDALRRARKQVFLDLKLHDIPNTVRRAVSAAARHEIAMLTLHAGGGRAMLAAAAEAARESGPRAPLLLAVTTLTSLNAADLAEIGIGRNLQEQAMMLGALAVEAGAGGLVASVHETAMLRRKFGGGLRIVTPGIRPAGAAVQDQQRIATPAAAVGAGSDFLVVGRPILEAPDPGAAAEAILAEIQSASRGGAD